MTLPASRSSPDAAPQDLVLTKEKVGAALRAFFAAVDAWGASAEQARILLGRPSRATLFNWKRGTAGSLPYDTLTRISLVLGIWRALQILFADPVQADGWLARPNTLFGGQTPLARMLAGQVTDLAAVRAVLDQARGGGI